MDRKRVFLRGETGALHRGVVAVAIGLAAASSAVALPAVQTVQITSGFMTTSLADRNGEWMLAGENSSAGGIFHPLGGELPADYFLFNPLTLGTSLRMSWQSDSVDGWLGQMLFNGVAYNLTSDSASTSSLMQLTANNILVGQAGSYMEPFTFAANFCGFLTVPMNTCDTTANLVGSGTLDLTVSVNPQLPGTVDIQSLSYRFAGVPEPGSISLLLTGLVGLGLTRRRGLQPASKRAGPVQSQTDR